MSLVRVKVRVRVGVRVSFRCRLTIVHERQEKTKIKARQGLRHGEC